jgi:urease accessory protein
MPDVSGYSGTNAKPHGREGRLEVVFQQDPEGRTYLEEQYFTYPFHICRAQYMDKATPDIATLYLQSCSGGIFRDDRLSIKIHGKEHSQVHVTTQASTIVHRMDEGFAEQKTLITGDEGSLVEYLPDCTILFPYAKFRSSVTVTRHHDSDVIISDSFLTHDPNGMAAPFSWFENELVISQPDGQIDAVDRVRVTGEMFCAGETPDSEQYSVQGMFAVISHRTDSQSLVRNIRSNIESSDGVYAGVSLLPNDAGCWIRYMAIDGAAAQDFSTTLWITSRKNLTGYSPSLRRK